MTTIFFLLSSIVFQETAWQEHADQPGRFQILVPGHFTHKTDSIETEVGNLAYHTFFLQSADEEAENLFYMVSYCDYPASVVFADSAGLVEEFFNNTIEAAAETVNGTIAYVADIQLENHPGKQWRIDYLDGKAVINNRAYLVGSRFYSLQTIRWQERSKNGDGIRFFDSFKLIPQ